MLPFNKPASLENIELEIRNERLSLETRRPPARSVTAREARIPNLVLYRQSRIYYADPHICVLFELEEYD